MNTWAEGAPVPPRWQGNGEANVKERETSPNVEVDLKDLEEKIEDPLKALARLIRGLTLEHATQAAMEMGDVTLRDRHLRWAVAKLDNGELPLKTEPSSTGGRI